MEKRLTFDEFRQKIQNTESIRDIYDILSPYGFKTSFYKANTLISHINGFTVGIKDDFTELYVTSKAELLFAETSTIHKSTIYYIFDNICHLDDNEYFYRLYFMKYGYPESESDEVKNVLKYFNEKKVIITDIFTSENYTSATIVGKRVNSTEVEYRLVNCDKQDIIDLITITHITPIINKKDKDYEYDNPYYNKPCVTTKDIMDSYNDYKDSLAYD